MELVKRFSTITFSIVIMAVGVYFFKFPNNFCFGGVTGAATVIAAVTPMSAGDFTTAANLLLLILAFFAVDRRFAIDTAYASVLLSGLLMLLEHMVPLSAPLSTQPLLELVFAIVLPAIGSALLFNIGASSGGTDVLAMMLKKHTQIKDTGIALLLCDLIMVVAACFVFDIQTALYSFVGLVLKSMVIDNIIQTITLCKAITVICNDPNPICVFIMKELHKGATVVSGYGAYSHDLKYIVFTTLTRRQALQLRLYIHREHMDAFISASDTNEVFGKGFSKV